MSRFRGRARLSVLRLRAPVFQMTFEELVHYLKLGGVTLRLILASSFVALGVAFERLVALWGFSGGSKVLGETIIRQLLRGDSVGARAAAERSTSLMADVFRAGFARADQVGAEGHALVHSAVERERAQLGLRLKRNLWILGTIGATAPFVGLLGTVVG